MTVLDRATWVARRTRQTVSVFDNGWSVLRQLAARADELAFEVDGLTIHCPNVPGARVPVYEVFAEDEYSLDWFGHGLPDDVHVVDIGAHIGCFSTDLLRRFPGATVHSYEPTPSTGAYTVRNVESNGLADRITVHRTAVGSRAGTLVMADNGPGSGHNGVLHLGEAGSVEIEVACDSIADAFAAAGGRVDLLKMDAEGAEYGILLDSDPTLWSGVRRLVMEYHHSEQHGFDDLRTFLEGTGMTLVRHETGGPGFGLAWFSRDALPPHVAV
ncbi:MULTISPECIES: FkbM family methyltransferase [unclassified Aeromicrobium]|uniref:FkbM family methyltransferase n=1 Tax=unclassified Aeromicrobium TaxID=2633570 RepID=UPI000AB553D3|nr:MULTISPECIES: FkbM family methyltransferase [unclassified Aeromicrobium]RYY45408.1 MAG: FkbM family methyltransferase [Actinomycetales bacterium]